MDTSILDEDWLEIIYVFDELWPHYKEIHERLQPWLDGEISRGELKSRTWEDNVITIQSYC